MIGKIRKRMEYPSWLIIWWTYGALPFFVLRTIYGIARWIFSGRKENILDWKLPLKAGIIVAIIFSAMERWRSLQIPLFWALDWWMHKRHRKEQA